jgi:hypothetical protein
MPGLNCSSCAREIPAPWALANPSATRAAQQEAASKDAKPAEIVAAASRVALCIGCAVPEASEPSKPDADPSEPKDAPDAKDGA